MQTHFTADQLADPLIAEVPVVVLYGSLVLLWALKATKSKPA